MTNNVDDDELIAFNKIIVDNPDFIMKLNHADNELIEYLFGHLSYIINYLFYSQTSAKINSTNVNRCLNLLLINNAKTRKKLVTETPFNDFLAEYPKEFSNIDHEHRFRYINVLNAYLNEKDLSVDKDVGTVELFENLVAVCDYQTSFDLLSDGILSMNYQTFFLQKIPLASILGKYIIGNKIVNYNAQKLMLQFDGSASVSETLTSNSLLLSFIDYSFSNLKYGKNFKFLRKIYKNSIKYLNRNSDWTTIELMISSRLNEFRTIVFNTKVWCETSIISICMISYILDQNPDLWIDNDYDLFYFLVGNLLSNPKFSKLHLALLRFFRTMEKLNKLNSNILYESNLIKIIIDKYKNRENCIDCAYWGVIRIMSKSITPFVKETEQKVWESIVVAKNLEIEEIIKKDEKMQPENPSTINERRLTLLLLFIISIVFLLIGLTIKYM